MIDTGIPVLSHFVYPSLSRDDTPNGRFYLCNEERLPSVTTILGKTKSEKDRKSLDDWRAYVGLEEAEKILQNSLTIGTALHKNMEEYLLFGKDFTNGTLQTKIMSKLMLKLFKGRLDAVWGSEVSLYCPGLYAGSADLVGIYDGEPAIIDFKNSRSMKKKEKMVDYWTQIAAYRHAHNDVYGTNIRRSVILMVSQDYKSQEFIVDGAENDMYDELWFDRLGLFIDQKNSDLALAA